MGNSRVIYNEKIEVIDLCRVTPYDTTTIVHKSTQYLCSQVFVDGVFYNIPRIYHIHIKEDLMDKGIDIVVSTRPDIIKLAPLILELNRRRIPFKIKWTKQHESYEMFTQFARIFYIEDLIKERAVDKPYYGIGAVYGDTDSCFKEAYAYKRSGRRVLHIEAGLRCPDEFMHEEINRRLTDRISNYFFCPTRLNMDNVIQEDPTLRWKRDFAWVTGNLISDALSVASYASIWDNNFKREPIQDLGILITIHRRENLYNPEFKVLLEQIQKLQKKYNTMFPIHPHTNFMLSGMETKVDICPPLGYPDFINAMKSAKIVITDSGGVLEECCILHKPCIVVREYTERPEATIRCGKLCPDYSKLEELVEFLMRYRGTELGDYKNPYLSPEKGQIVSETMSNIIKRIIED